MSAIIKADLGQIVADGAIPWKKLDKTTILVTGGTGMIGAALVRALSALREAHRLDLSILASGRNQEKAAPLVLGYGAEFWPWDVRQPPVLAAPVDYIFHGAAITASAVMAARPATVALTGLQGTAAALELARVKGVRSMVFLSSVEVYGDTGPAADVSENDLGRLDLSDPRSCYPESKRMGECLCHCYAAQYALPVKIARLAQTFGAGASPEDPRVFAQFARSALTGRDIVLQTEGKSFGNYCYLSDAVRALLLLLLKGENGEAYNITNPAAGMTIREMAETVAQKVCGGRIRVTTAIPADRAALGYAAGGTGRLSAAKMAALGWEAAYGLAEMYERLLADWLSWESLVGRA
ncbi:MAG: NAD(P)-dependent oxidoreductase [Gracilibacteraceae bacterium]|jgi:nucleoside-diphosphate-sugar epimerase|nr:NAD(P)-dependent oxidoreductase [Gracilibacteraceae bacterium]